MKWYTALYLIFPLLLSCSNFKKYEIDNKTLCYEVLEQAGNNKYELEKVFSHYREGNDSLKLEAAYYLIANMSGGKSLAIIESDAFNEDFLTKLRESTPMEWSVNQTENHTVSNVKRLLDSVNSRVSLTSLCDVDIMTADMLISNIDQAFDQWEKSPWAQEYTFKDFCEWVLPYRFSTEELEDWRLLALNDRKDNEKIPLSHYKQFPLAITLMSNQWMRFHFDFNNLTVKLPYSKMSVLLRGNCGQIAQFGVQLMRSRGIPSAIDAIPAWAERNSNHSWPAIIYPGGRSQDINFSLENDGSNIIYHKVSKIYRTSNTILRNDPLNDLSKDEVLPVFFTDLNRLDVTSQYDMPLSDVWINNMNPSDAKIAWLCTFNNSSWVPVAYAPVKNNSALFENMGRGVQWGGNKPAFTVDAGDGILYFPAYRKKAGLIAAANPLIVHENGRQTEVIVDTSVWQNITLKRKYPKRQIYLDFENALVGAVIECASNIDFNDAITVYTIEKPPINPLEKWNISLEKKYRFIRIKIPGNIQEARIAEFKVFDSLSEEVNGKLIFSRQNHIESPRYLMDNNILTSFIITNPSEEWIGIDFGKAVDIGALAISSYTDDNEIIPGEEYELRYWDNGWKIVGRRIADGHTMGWDAPRGALLWLRNLTKGVEERIFTYHDGKQIWW